MNWRSQSWLITAEQQWFTSDLVEWGFTPRVNHEPVPVSVSETAPGQNSLYTSETITTILAAVVQLNPSLQPVPLGFLHLCQKRTFADKWKRFFTGQTPFLPSNQHHWSIKENSEHSLQPRKITHSLIQSSSTTGLLIPMTSVGSSPLLRPWAHRWINYLSLWRMTNATPDLWLHSQSQDIADPRQVPNYTTWWQRHMCVNNLPKVVTWQRNGRVLNLAVVIF